MQKMIDDCIASHPLCREFYEYFNGSTTEYATYGGPNKLITTILGASLPSPDGREWNEFHHIGGRAHSDVGRLISRDLHAAIHSGKIREIDPPVVKFHCLEPGREWAEAYLKGSSWEKPSKPIQILWDLRLRDLKHRENGEQALNASLQIEEFVMDSIKEYIHEVRIRSWDESGTVMKYNISPGDSPANTSAWTSDIKHQIKTWYTLGPAQKQHVNHVASIYGHLGTKLFMNGFEFDEIQDLVSTHRMAHSMYRIAKIIYQSDEDPEILVDKLKQDLEETTSLSDDARAKELISRWVNSGQPQQQGLEIERFAFFNRDKIFLITSIPFDKSTLERIGNLTEAVPITFDVIEVINDNIQTSNQNDDA